MNSNIEYLVSGLRKIKDAALLNIISYILVAAFYIIAFYSIMTFPPASLIIGFIVLIVASILSLIALFAFLIPGFEDLRDYDPSNFNTSCILIKIGFAGGLILVIVAIALVFYLISIGVSIYTITHPMFYMHHTFTVNVAISETYVGNMLILIGIVELLFIISLVLLLIGYVGLIIGMFKLKDVTGEDLFLAAAILFIISIFLPILDFIAWILTYIGAGEAVKRVKEGH